MYDSVKNGFPSFTEKCEGRVLFPYLDWNGAPTTGVGCIVNTLPLMLALPWKLPDGTLASAAHVTEQWNKLRADTALAKMGYQHAELVTDIRLSEADVDALTLRRMAANDIELHKYVLAFEQVPGDAQCALHSMAYAMGASKLASAFPKFLRAVNARDWATALLECKMDETNNPGLPRRNAQNRICLQNALAVQYDVDHAGRARGTHLYTLTELYWPRALPNPQQAA